MDDRNYLSMRSNRPRLLIQSDKAMSHRSLSHQNISGTQKRSAEVQEELQPFYKYSRARPQCRRDVKRFSRFARRLPAKIISGKREAGFALFCTQL